MFIGATRTSDARELTYARQSVVVHAKAYGIQAVDMVYINFKGNMSLKLTIWDQVSLSTNELEWM